MKTGETYKKRTIALGLENMNFDNASIPGSRSKQGKKRRWFGTVN
jgi:hypothetical protein